MDKGWIKLHRSIENSKLHFLNNKRDATEYEAWIDLQMKVNFKPKPWEGLECGVGEALYSLDWYGRRWGWTKSKVRRWFLRLQKWGLIRYINETITVRVIVLNYEKEQGERNEDGTLKDPYRKKNGAQLQSTKELKQKKELKELQEKPWRDLKKWFEGMDDVDSPIALTRKYSQIYKAEYVRKALKDPCCTNRASFVEVCEYLKSVDNSSSKEDNTNVHPTT